MGRDRSQTRTGGRPATTGIIHGQFALSVGSPDIPLPDGWSWTALTDVARLESGHTPSRRHPEYWGGDIPWVGIRDATNNHGRILSDTNQHTNELGIANSAARVLPANTVCLSRTASVGYVVVMGRPMATSQDFVNWVCSDSLDFQFLKYVLLSEQSSFLRFASGTTHQTIYFPEVKAFHVALPPLAEQKAIASVFSSLDDKIDLLQRQNKTLEAMAETLFRQWFVEEADESWEEGCVGDILELHRGYDLAAHMRKPGIVPVIAASGVNGFHCEHKITGPGVATGRSGTIGQVHYIAEDFWPLNTSLYVSAFRKGSPLFCYFFLKSLELERLNAGSAVPTLNRNHVHELPVSIPPDAVIKRFEETCVGFFTKIDLNRKQIKTLESLRDTLLPKLMSGEVRVAL